MYVYICMFDVYVLYMQHIDVHLINMSTLLEVDDVCMYTSYICDICFKINNVAGNRLASFCCLLLLHTLYILYYFLFQVVMLPRHLRMHMQALKNRNTGTLVRSCVLSNVAVLRHLIIGAENADTAETNLSIYVNSPTMKTESNLLDTARRMGKKMAAD